MLRLRELGLQGSGPARVGVWWWSEVNAAAARVQPQGRRSCACARVWMSVGRVAVVLVYVWVIEWVVGWGVRFW